MVIEFLILVVIHLGMYLPMLFQLLDKVGIKCMPLDFLLTWIPVHVARGAEVASGIALPILCFTFMPAYRKFCNEPDPDDLKLSKPKCQYSYC